jgi:hypothetical protein
MHILELHEAKVSTLNHTTSSMGIYMAAQRRVLSAVCAEIAGVKIADIPGKSLVGKGVTFGMRRCHVIQHQVYRVNRRHTVPLSHYPRACETSYGVDSHVASIGRYHVKNATGMPLRFGLKISRAKVTTIKVYSLDIGLVDRYPHGGTGYPIGSVEHFK